MSALTGEAAGVQGAPHAADAAAALELCYLRHHGELVGYLVTLVGDRALAQDLAQEAFIDLFSRWRTVRHPRAYVFAAATNLARGFWRRREREGRALATVNRVTPSTQGEHDPWLWDMVSRLPEKHRVPVLLHYYADLSVADVAAQLHLPQGSVKRRLHEARQLLLSVLEDFRA